MSLPYIGTVKIGHRSHKIGPRSPYKFKFQLHAPAKSAPDLYKSAAENCRT